MKRYLPCLRWLKDYDRRTAGQDALAALVMTLLLIPQSLAYAMLAGLPPVTGLYASILPLVAYALFGTSHTLAVGPVAIVSLMVAASLGTIATAGTAAYAGAALLLALLSGLALLAMSVLRLGFLANFLSHPVISGFISASGLLIALNQLQHLLGIDSHGNNALELLRSLLPALPGTHLPTLAIGATSLALLHLMRHQGAAGLGRLGLTPGMAQQFARSGPIIALVGSIAVVTFWRLDEAGVRVVGHIPIGLPPLTLPPLEPDLIRQLLPAAVLIALVSFVQSISVAQSMAARKRQRIDPDQELAALGSANIAAALSGGLPVSGGFARTAIGQDAGAQTPMSGALTAVGTTLVLLLFVPLLHNLPQAVLAATIIVAVLGLVDLKAIRKTWRYSRQDGVAMLATLAGVLLIGIEAGILLGVGLSLALFLWRTRRPHIAVVGQLPGSEHFRNVERFSVVSSQSVLSVRVDENLYFPNARYLEERILELVARHPQARHLVLMCSGINLIDASALDSLEAIDERLRSAGIALHLSEVKGPVLDRLLRTDFLDRLSGRVFVSQFEALRTLDPDSTRNALERPPQA
ncbi:SulP family inorganic anion transporter [Stutzerimonas kirkiae]|uniref:SulP family inorganic anion transporter n=1 Tax=Stutzerimonas kirkiae TaxID=2211392 RepID=UPI0010382D47|nr:sulfate permease [Stutzerimonas kirkiae]TBV10314.1 sodium-independent anion transporter [Stutzerimonas kirkiae]TBV16893.1 sodium-independent anion transporter [Stutzerimonas kirkiae]